MDADRAAANGIRCSSRLSEEHPSIGIDRAAAHDRLQTIVADLIRDEAVGCYMPADVVADHIAATFVRVLNWWIDSRSPARAAEMNHMFRSLVAPAIRPR